MRQEPFLYMKFLESDIAKKYDLISLNLDAKNSIKNGRVSFVGCGSVLDGYFGIHMDSIHGMSTTNTALSKSYEITTKIQNSIVIEFEPEEIIVVADPLCTNFNELR